MPHLVLVPTHAVWSLRGDPLADSSWYLKPYQQGEPGFYLAHIRHGVGIAANNPGALLVLSGGQTERAAGAISEAQSYLALAENYDWWGSEEVRARCIVEEFALDSFQNLLFGICRFREIAGHYPRAVTVTGWIFKTRRFRDLHRPAIRFPAGRFRYEGVNDPLDLAAARHAEQLTCAAFEADPYGAGGELAEKRRRRNPFGRNQNYAAGCPELASLLRHCGPEPFSGSLPWDA